MTHKDTTEKLENIIIKLGTSGVFRDEQSAVKATLDLEAFIASEKERSRREEIEFVLEMIEKSKGSDAPISITIEQFLKGRLATLTPTQHSSEEK